MFFNIYVIFPNLIVSVLKLNWRNILKHSWKTKLNSAENGGFALSIKHRREDY